MLHPGNVSYHLKMQKREADEPSESENFWMEGSTPQTYINLRDKNQVMRRADLRAYDIGLINGILGTFCAFSFAFFLFLYGGYIVAAQIPVKLYLWTSYGFVILLIVFFFFATKKNIYEWIRVVGASDMIGKGKFPVEKGKSYLIKSQREGQGEEMLADALTYKVPCLYITRTHPDILRQKNAWLKDANLLWLSEAGEKNAVNPTDVEELLYTMRRYLDKAGPSVVLFEGLPYMLTSLPFQKVLYFLQDVRDYVALQQSVLLFSLDESILDTGKNALIKQELLSL